MAKFNLHRRKSEDDSNNFPDIHEEIYLRFAHSELTASVWLTQFGINGQCKIYMICWFLSTEISLMFAIVSIYKICASRRDNMWFFFPPTAFWVLCFIIRFSLKLGKIQEESPSPSRPAAKILCAYFSLEVDDRATVFILNKMLRLYNKRNKGQYFECHRPWKLEEIF